MTNTLVLLKLSVSLSTNWVTVSTTSPVIPPSEIGLAVYRPPIANQVGTIHSNVIGSFEWKGKTNSVVLESTQIGQLERGVDANTMMPWPFLK